MGKFIEKEMKHFTIILALLILTSCGTTKEMRRSNRAAKKLERLVAKYPELKRTDTVLTKVSMKTPELTGTIIQPLLVPGDKEFITLPGKPIFLPGAIEPFSIPFSDTLIDALFTYNGTDFALDYTIKPIPVDTIVPTELSSFRGTRYEPIPLPWWKITLMVLGAVFLCMILLIVASLIVRAIK